MYSFDEIRIPIIRTGKPYLIPPYANFPENFAMMIPKTSCRNIDGSRKQAEPDPEKRKWLRD